MIQTITKRFGLRIINNIFSTKIHHSDWAKLVSYSTFLGSVKPKFFIKNSKYTVLIYLAKSDEELLMATKSKTRNQIRKAMKDNVACIETFDIDDFVAFYNDFAREKGLDLITYDTCIKYGKSLVLTKAVKDGATLCYHATLKDDELQRGLLLYSASSRFTENIDRTLIGNANRYLHYYDFCMLRDYGINYYDFGGIYLDDKDKAKMSIADFKQSFGGEVVPIVSYQSPLFFCINKISGIVNKLKCVFKPYL